MSAPTGQKKPPAKKAQGKAAVKRSPRAARPEAPADETPKLSDEELAALAGGGQDDDELAPGEIRPVIIGKRGRRGDAPIEMVTLFELNDVPYQIPKNPSAALVLTWLMDVQTHGLQSANSRVGMQILGEEAMRALAASPEVEPEDLGDIFANIGIVFFASENYRKIMEAPDPS